MSEKVILEYSATIPLNYRGVFIKSASGNTKAGAIRAKCQQCVGYEDAVIRIRECKTQICPLHPYRPYQVDEVEECS